MKRIEDFRLSDEEIARFVRDGYLGPYPVRTPAEMARMTPAIEAALQVPPPDHQAVQHNRHLDIPLINQLATDPAIVGRMASLYGPDLLLWRTNFFIKESGAAEIPMHQDYNYWPLEPAVIISAWIAIDRCTVDNSCLRLLPGSHRTVLPHVKADKDMMFAEMADPARYDREACIPIEMEPGEFILFNERTLHGSEANRSSHRRMGLAVRVVIPLVQVTEWDAPNHALQLLCGKDPHGFNRVREPLAAKASSSAETHAG